jgi:hypothetical protein
MGILLGPRKKNDIKSENLVDLEFKEISCLTHVSYSINLIIKH